MIGATFCSGIGAPEVAAAWIDWRFASEIEPFPRAVLQERFGYKTPDDHNQGDPLLWGDMTEISPDMWRAHGLPLPEIIVAGTPCQDFSIAGLREGLKGARGNLTLKFVEICHAIVDARPDGKLRVLWENVPGVLSDSGNAFGNFLGGLIGADHAIPRPNGESWPSAGMVAGPRARLAWRVLDAQYFGVAQRRRRVFVVVDFGGGCDPAKVLFERQGLRGNPAPRRTAGQDLAGNSGSGASHWSGGPHPSLSQSHNTGGIGSSNQEIFSQQGAGIVAARMTAIGEYTIDETAGTLKQRDYKDATDLVISATGEVSHALTGEGFDASEDGTGRGTPIVVHGTHDPITSHIALPLGRNAGQENGSNPKAGAPCHPLAAEAHPPAVAFDMRGREWGAQFEGPHETANIRAASGGSSRSYVAAHAVRRLMPVECARLQGFSDGHLDIDYRGKPACDGPKYKGFGNSMAVPVIAWILERMK